MSVTSVCNFSDNLFHSLSASLNILTLHLIESSLILYLYFASLKALVCETSQSITVEAWDYDSGFPGVLNDDFLGRSPSILFSVCNMHA